MREKVPTVDPDAEPNDAERTSCAQQIRRENRVVLQTATGNRTRGGGGYDSDPANEGEDGQTEQDSAAECWRHLRVSSWWLRLM